MKALRSSALAMAVGLSGAMPLAAGELTIATVNNGHMVEMQNLPLILRPRIPASP